jgi:hypothetical protein
VPDPTLLTIYVDDAFTPGERNLLEAAAISLNIQSEGRLAVELRSGLDPARFWVPPGAWRFLRIVSDSDLTRRFDWRNGRDEAIVGICVRASQDLYLVPDRIRTSEQFLSVAMHEVLHAVGLEHTGVDSSVMAEKVGDHPPVRLTPVDVRELRRALKF